MTRDELVAILDEILRVLQINRSFMTDDVLANLDNLVKQAKSAAEVLEKVVGISHEQLQKIFAAADNFMQFEHKLLKTDLGMHLEQALERLKHRRVILRMLVTLF